MTFGARFKELREAAGLSQAALAGRAGISPRAVSHWEQGLRDPGWQNVLSLAAVLGVPVGAFTQAPASTPEPRRGRPPKATPSTPPAAELQAAKRARTRKSKGK